MRWARDLTVAHITAKGVDSASGASAEWEDTGVCV